MSAIIEQARAMRAETVAALRTVYGALSRGQQQKLCKDRTVLALLERYGVVTGEEESQ